MQVDGPRAIDEATWGARHDLVATSLLRALSRARQAAEATVLKRYLPVATAAPGLASTLDIVIAMRLFA